MEIKQMLQTSIRTSIFLLILCGGVYPAVSTAIAQLTMEAKADGSLLYNEDKEVIGSELIGQNFLDPSLFHSRISSIEYNAAGSGSLNYAPSNEAMHQRIKDSIDTWEAQNPTVPIEEVPIDILTNSASGLDPHISPEAANAQIDRIAKATGHTKQQLQQLVKEHTEHRQLGLFGEPKVNVLLLNIALTSL